VKLNKPLWVGALASASLILTAVAPATAATADPPTEVVQEGFVSPLKLALDLDGTKYVADSFVGALHRISWRGDSTVAYTAAPGTELAAVSAFAGTVYFAERVGTMETVDAAVLKTMDRRGNVTTVADLLAYEQQENPDAGQHYGFSDLDPACAAQLPPGVPLDYEGLIDSHPYATLGTPLGTVVADAGSNALLTVDRRGNVRTLAVLPPQRTVVGEWGVGLGLPACAIGQRFDFEPVPTDVELGPDGWLYVTLLPGGPEDPSAGARGSVVRVNLWRGTVETVATGFAGATDLAVAPNGDIYVAELFGGRIALVEKGSSEPVTFREVATPAAVEWSPRGLYATIDALGAEGAPPAGKLVFLPF
jgi:hypothetical protein